MNIFSVAIICLTVTVLAKLIEPSASETKFLLITATLILLMIGISSDINSLISEIRSISDSINLADKPIGICTKILGISYLCELCSNSCKDAGESALASAVEICSKVAVAIICLPIISGFLGTVVKILE